MVRVDKVNALVDAALAGMLPLSEGTSTGEVASACFTLALRAIRICKRQGTPDAALRQAAEQLLMECASTEQRN